MDEAEQRILRMVEEGVISAEEANNLLAVLGPDDSVGQVAGEAVVVPDIVAERKEDAPAIPPGLARIRRLWAIPLFIAAGSLLLSGAGLILMYQATANVAAFGFLCVWSIFIVAGLLLFALLMTRRGAWLYVHVEQRHGNAINVGFPVPLRLFGWAAGVARPFVPARQSAQLDTAVTFVKALQDDPARQPIVVDVDDEDGDKVQVYLG